MIARAIALFGSIACAPAQDIAGDATDGAASEASENGEAGDDRTSLPVEGSGSETASASGSGGSDDATASADTTEGDGPEVPRWEQLIRADPYPRLVIEVDYVAGREPRPLVVADIEATFAALLDKPGGVEVVLDQVIPTSDPEHAWTVEERIDLAIATSDLVVDDDTIKIHALFVDGHAEEDDMMDTVLLGVAWGHENIMMWRDTLDAGCEGAVVGPLLEQLCADAEFLIWQHEIGHVIGLVDLGLPMVDDHLDPEQGAGKHDVSHDCVMYRAYEGLDAVDAVLDRLVMGGPAIEFDAPCIADIDAVQ